MGKKNDPKVKQYAAWMKDHFIIRRTARCTVCYKIVAIPMDRHFVGGNCS